MKSNHLPVLLLVCLLGVGAIFFYFFGSSIPQKEKVVVSGSYERTEVLSLIHGGVADDAKQYCNDRNGEFDLCGPVFCEEINEEWVCEFNNTCSLTCTYPPPMLSADLGHRIPEAVYGTRFPVVWSFSSTTPPLLLVHVVSAASEKKWPVAVLRDTYVTAMRYDWHVGLSIGGSTLPKMEVGEYYFQLSAYSGEVCVGCNSLPSPMYTATTSTFTLKIVE